ncbi:MAG: DUF695 domain-containing protein [Pseudomonadota bacterium]
MSDHWEFFSCQMGENVAFIFYDHGIRETIDSFNHNQQVRFDLTYKSPNDKGLPTDEEFDAVKGIEDNIEEFAAEHGGIYVGRVTTAGHRYFYSFLGAPTEKIQDFVSDVEEATGYGLKTRVVDDPEKKGYWDDLYPTADDWQMIQDSKTVDALRDAGDVGHIARRIDHWSFFKNKSDAKKFIEWMEGEGFALQEMRRTKPLIGKWVVKYYRTDSPELYTINHITFQLRHKSSELGGKYDGWETSVEKGQG